VFSFLLASQPPTDACHDPLTLTILAIIATLLAGLIGVVVAYFIFRKQVIKKIFSYQIVSNAPIAVLNKALQNQVTILINGQTVTNARQVVFTIRNEGNTAVKRDDYDEPIKFTFVDSKIVGSDVIGTNPPELMKSIHNTTLVKDGDDGAKLEPMLLNAKDSITFTLLLEGDFNRLDVSGRIVDGSIIQRIDREIISPMLITTINEVAFRLVAK
jgi:hypothetical protein